MMLIGCEQSGVVREAMRKVGVDCWSCDLLPSEDNSPFHIQGDILEVMEQREWDAFGFHPDCTYLTVAGIHWNNRGRGWDKTCQALEFIKQILWRVGDRPYYLENPVSIISTHIAPPDQIIQPYQFGDDASKKTCLWLNRLPKLEPTSRFPPRLTTHKGRQVMRWSNQTDSGQNRLGPSPERWKIRSRTYHGIGNAMAAQWQHLLK